MRYSGLSSFCSEFLGPPSEVAEATAKQAKTKAALDMVPILGQGLVTEPALRCSQADLDSRCRAAAGSCFSGCCCELEGRLLVLFIGWLLSPALLSFLP